MQHPQSAPRIRLLDKSRLQLSAQTPAGIAGTGMGSEIPFQKLSVRSCGAKRTGSQLQIASTALSQVTLKSVSAPADACCTLTLSLIVTPYGHGDASYDRLHADMLSSARALG